MGLRSILERIQEELTRKEEFREEMQKSMRKATRLSKQAILYVHHQKFEKAEELLEEAENLFSELRKVSKKYPELFYSGLVDVAFQEYAEARTLLELVTKNEFINPKKLGIPASSYVLGLVDVIGEFRRRALDSLRRGDVKTAEDCLQRMEHIYTELMAMNDAYLLISGLRRKCDVARRIIETTRGDVTIEVRRGSLEKSIERLEKIVKRKGKTKKS